MALSFETCKTYKLVGAVSTEQLRFILDPTRDWMIDWINVKISFVKSGVCKILKIIYTRRTHPNLSLIFVPSLIRSFIHSFFLLCSKLACLARGGKKKLINQCNLCNYPNYFYSYIDVTMPIVEFYLSWTVLTTKCLF